MPVLAALAAGVLLAGANGANDNFKGVATLWGSGTTSYRKALAWATVTTLLGSGSAFFLAMGLLHAFSGKGLVPDAIAAAPAFPLAVALAAGVTVLLASRLGLPISTTHALLGGLVGAGLLASPAGVATSRLWNAFFLPLLASPFAAVGLATTLYPLLRRLRARLGVEPETCVCIGNEVAVVLPGTMPAASPALLAIGLPAARVGEAASCRVRYAGRVLGFDARTLLDAAHIASGGAVGFARGLNDTPKIAALLLAGGAASPAFGLAAAAVAMALGGVLGARRVADTMSHRITGMNPGQAFTANVVTSALVAGASHFGLPVSTTHVSVGALFGIGSATRRARWSTVRQIVLSWIVTLPLAALLGAAAWALLRRFA